uniref:SH3b domain-containing protein n=1 Tax=Streptomyces sp. NBC_00049 TaxID=2903617 RepID=A0AAU2K410_9ACTN
MKKSVLMCTLAAGLALGPMSATGWAAERHAADPVASAAQVAYTVGEVVSDEPLNVRRKPTVYSGTVKKLRPGQRVLLACERRGGWVDGNPLWYRLHGSNGWVSARFVHNHQPVRPC